MLAPALATSQQPRSLSETLQHLAAEAAKLEQSLPSISCMESVISQERRHGKVIRSVEFTAAVRAIRSPDGVVNETREYRTVGGKPFLSGGFVMPSYVTGGFSRALTYFSAEQQPCYTYTLEGTRIDFRTVAHPPELCRTRGTTGFALLDASGNIVHLERRVEDHFAVQYHFVPYAILDLAPLTLNGTSYSITRHLLSEQPNRGSIDTFDATYADCQLFRATVTIGPAVEAPDARANPK